MFKIQTLNKIALSGLNQFPKDRYHISPEVQEPDAILVRSQVMHNETIPFTVKAIGRAGVGINNIPVSHLTKRGVPVFNTPGANANAVKELVIAGMLMASRHLAQAWQYVNQLQGEDGALEQAIEAHKKQFAGIELMGKTLGVIGLGSIGVQVANAAIHLGMQVVGYDPAISVARAWELSANVKQAHHLDELLSQVDFVSFHVPLLPETKHMINQQRIAAMKPGIVILNFARDGIIEQAALLAALNENKVSAYVNDFPSALLKNHPRVISLPHLGASTQEAEENCAVMIAKQIRDFLEFGVITHSTNFPTVHVPKQINGARLAIVNANVPSMVAQISTKLAAAKLNIVNMFNQSRDEIAYTIIDIAHEVQQLLLDEIAKIEGVVQVRCIHG